ncbi:MAG: hypothetical protein WD225_12940 [Ilumatobacteraceae bacterium]
MVDDPMAREILDEFYTLPDTLSEPVPEMFERFARRGLQIIGDERGADDDTCPWTRAHAPVHGIAEGRSALATGSTTPPSWEPWPIRGP